jgi:hypothetical protein
MILSFRAGIYTIPYVRKCSRCGCHMSTKRILREKVLFVKGNGWLWTTPNRPLMQS